MESTYLIVGLGNPGKLYETTRHNIGFMVVDFLSSKFKKSWEQVFDTFWSTAANCQQQKMIFLKPDTYMNLSGMAVVAGVREYKIAPSNLLIICDDINLNFGTIRIRPSGSDGGQKGLRSIIQELDSQDFPRLRIGIGDQFDDPVEHVLSSFNFWEQKQLPGIIEIAAEAALSFVHNGIELTMSRFNRAYFGI